MQSRQQKGRLFSLYPNSQSRNQQLQGSSRRDEGEAGTVELRLSGHRFGKSPRERVAGAAGRIPRARQKGRGALQEYGAGCGNSAPVTQLRYDLDMMTRVMLTVASGMVDKGGPDERA